MEDKPRLNCFSWDSRKSYLLAVLYVTNFRHNISVGFNYSGQLCVLRGSIYENSLQNIKVCSFIPKVFMKAHVCQAQYSQKIHNLMERQTCKHTLLMLRDRC